MMEEECPLCHGSRLKKDILSVLVGKKNIYEMTKMSIRDLYSFFSNLKLNEEQTKISELLIKEIIKLNNNTIIF